MSMSQEEIEALMNGLDISDDTSEPSNEASEDTSLDTSEIDELISTTEVDTNDDLVEPSVEEKIEEPKVEPVVEEAIEQPQTVDNDDIDALLKGLEEENNDSSNVLESSNDILKELEETSDDSTVSNDDIDAMLSQVDGITDSEPMSEPEPIETLSETVEESKQKESVNTDDIVKDWTDSKISEGVFPLPAEKDTKVVNQLNQVANDSEEKVSQIFDVLSLTLDNNNELRNKLSSVENYLESEKKLLESLNAKFPNINIFEEHLNKTNELNESLEKFKNNINDEDMKIFEAMELMQFNDINRQKIERVMAVIRKLSLYLNNLFEDDYSDKEVVVAKHIHGDTTNDLVGDDLDKLIEEFGK